jgi:E3 ubiquitin-protein ligase SHPRH
LIVTPPSLASQWADELALHAPHLNVFVYNGWAKVGVPITASDVQAERVRRRRARAKQKTGKTSANGQPLSARKKQVADAKDKAGFRARNKLVHTSDDQDDADLFSNSEDDGDPDDDEEEHIIDWCSYIHTYDVCITTYTILQQDLRVARAPPVRPRREDVVYSNVERCRSPLVMCEWHRVIMDEVQMVGGRNTEWVQLNTVFLLPSSTLIPFPKEKWYL